MKCKYCGENEVKEYNIKNTDYTCSPCHYKRHKEKILQHNDKWIRTSLPKGVYLIYEGDEVIYVGESGRMKGRINNHFHSQGTEETANWISAINLYIREKGKDKFRFEVVEEIQDKETRLEVEKYYISLYNPKFNTYGK